MEQEKQEPDLLRQDFDSDLVQAQDLAIEHEVIEEPVIEPPDLQQARVDLQTAKTVEISEESPVIHEGEKRIWKPPTSQDNSVKNKKL